MTAKTPGGVERAAPGCGSPARVFLSINSPAAAKESPARERLVATDDKILAALAVVTNRLSKLKSSQRDRDEDERMLSERHIRVQAWSEDAWTSHGH